MAKNCVTCLCGIRSTVGDYAMTLYDYDFDYNMTEQ